MKYYAYEISGYKMDVLQFKLFTVQFTVLYMTTTHMRTEQSTTLLLN